MAAWWEEALGPGNRTEEYNETALLHDTLAVHRGLQRCTALPVGNIHDLLDAFDANSTAGTANATTLPLAPAPTSLFNESTLRAMLADPTYCDPSPSALGADDLAHPVYLVATLLTLAAVWGVGWLAMLSYTSGGMVVFAGGRRRRYESQHLAQQRVHCALTYFVELPQFLALSFSPLLHGVYPGAMRDIGDALAWFVLPNSVSFHKAAVGVVWAITAVLSCPLLMFLCTPKRYNKVAAAVAVPEVDAGAEDAVPQGAGDGSAPAHATGRLLHRLPIYLLEWIRDLYFHYLCLPIACLLLSCTKCDYSGGEGGRSYWDREEACYSSAHAGTVALGVVTFLVYYGSCLFAGALPSLVDKVTDLTFHGRFTILQAQWKVFFAAVFLFIRDYNEWAQLVLVAAGLGCLSHLTQSMRPCPVEKLSFYKKSVFPLALWACFTSLVAAAMDDPTAHSSVNMLVGGQLLLGTLLAIRYYLVPYTEVVTPLDLEGGTYEGDVSLALSLRHGSGTQSWGDNAVYTGSWVLGEVTGRGVFRLVDGKYYEGSWWRGNRQGFGRTTILPNPALEYEGHFEDDEFHGYGRKTFVDGEVYSGQFRGGVEHGLGQWTFVDQSVVYGTWSDGVFGGNAELAHERELGDVLEGKTRYGVLHGWGRQLHDEGRRVYEGDFAAGMRHGEGLEVLFDVSDDGDSFEERYSGGFNNDRRHGVGTWARNYDVEKHKEARWMADMPPVAETAPRGVGSMYYDGTWDAGKMNGLGFLHAPQRFAYDGSFEEDEFHGYGHLLDYGIGHDYKGAFRHGRYDGKGVLVVRRAAKGVLDNPEDGPAAATGPAFAGNETYDGPFADGRFHGPNGVYTYADGAMYRGSWVDGEQDGRGTLTLKGAGCYKGVFAAGGRSDPDGVFEFVDGSRYEGAFEDGCLQGHGTLLLKSALRVADLVGAGAVPAGQPQPPASCVPFHPYHKKRLTDMVGARYTGSFASGAMHGDGTLAFSDGATYAGTFVVGFPEGVGRLALPSGEVYEGGFVCGERCGEGTATYPDGRVYSGAWEDGRRHGRGVLRHSAQAQGGAEAAAVDGYYFRDTLVGPNAPDLGTPEEVRRAPSVCPTEVCSLPETLPAGDLDTELAALLTQRL